MALNGSLDDDSPDGALRELSATGQTGAVRFTGAHGCTVYLHEGQLYFARADDTDEALAAALVRPGRLSADEWTRAVEESGEEPRVAEVLVEGGSIDSDLLASVVLSVVYDPLISLFRDGDGTFEFEPDVMHWLGASRAFNVDAIVNEVQRRVREVDEMAAVVPGVSAWVTPRRSLPDGAAQVTLLREDWELITSLQGARTIVDLAVQMGRGRYSAARVVHRLALAGLVEVTADPADTSGPPAPHEPSAFERMRRPADEADRDTGDESVSGEDDGDGGPADPWASPSWGSDWDDSDGPSPWAGGGSDGNPFEHPADDSFEHAAYAPVTNGYSITGPESAPDEVASLPRRQRVAVQDAPPGTGFDKAWARTGTDEERGDDEPAVAGLNGISGFHNPITEAGGRTDTDLAEATDGQAHANTEWLESLYAQFIDEPAEPPAKKRKKEALDVAFQADEQDSDEKTGTLKRLLGALRRV